MNDYITECDTWQAHEKRSQQLHEACQNAYMQNRQTELMREGYLHHLKMSCDNMEDKWLN